MGTKTPRPDTLEPEIVRLIDLYVNDVMAEPDTVFAPPRGRLARSSESMQPIDDFMAPPSVDPAAELVRVLAAAMPGADPDGPEFVDESPTDLSSPPTHIAGDDEDTAVFSTRRRR